jgi:hypothetical protein
MHSLELGFSKASFRFSIDEKSKVINLSFFKLTSNKLFETLMFIIENGFILYFIAPSIERILILLSDILNVLEMCYNYKSFYYTFFYIIISSDTLTPSK